MNPSQEDMKSGWYVEKQRYPRFGGWAFTIGLTKDLAQYCKNGYDKPISHTGYKTGIFVVLFDYQISIGYQTIQMVDDGLL